jgi:D-alanyl-D-alanine dipeptidase
MAIVPVLIISPAMVSTGGANITETTDTKAGIGTTGSSHKTRKAKVRKAQRLVSSKALRLGSYGLIVYPNGMQVKPLTYADLVDIPVQECHEPMVSLNEFAPEIVCAPINSDMLAYCSSGIQVRRGVAERLQRAAVRLKGMRPQAALQVVYGYRHPAIQERYFKEIFTRLQRDNPTLSSDELTEKTHSLIAVPSVAGHPTGAAVDVTILVGGVVLDMGTPIWDLEQTSLIPTFTAGISDEQRAHRMLLRDLLMHEHFAPFDGEWWHFSYGDREWAAYYRQSCARYAPFGA